MIEVKGITIDKKWKWIAKDEVGLVYVYENIPIKKEYTWERAKGSGAYNLAPVYPIELNSIPWGQSLYEIRHTEDGIILTPFLSDLIIDDPVVS